MSKEGKALKADMLAEAFTWYKGWVSQRSTVMLWVLFVGLMSLDWAVTLFPVIDMGFLVFDEIAIGFAALPVVGELFARFKKWRTKASVETKRELTPEEIRLEKIADGVNRRPLNRDLMDGNAHHMRMDEVFSEEEMKNLSIPRR